MIFFKIASWTGLLTVTLRSPECEVWDLSSIFSAVLLLTPDIPLSVLNVPVRRDGGLLLLVLLLLLLPDLLLLLDLDLRLATGLLLLHLSLYLGLRDLDRLCLSRYLSWCSLSLRPSFL